MKRSDFLHVQQIRVARIAVGPSTVRNQGAAGIVDSARAYFVTLDLSPLSTSNSAQYSAKLDRLTRQLRGKLPGPARSWGLARKLLNIFVRNAFYNIYLSEMYGLAKAEALLEIPLDSITASKLKQETGRGRLPSWPGVKKLTPELSASFQAAASNVAVRYGCARVHLDAYWWGVR
jgi:hypothetical protein